MTAKKNQLKWGTALSYFQMALNILIGLIYTPLMIRLLGKSEYGLYNTVASTISMLSILSFGFNSSYIKYYSKYKKENNKNGINNLNGLFIFIFSIIGFTAFVCGLFLSFHLEYVFSKGLTLNEYHTAKILMLLLTFNLTVSFPMSVFGNIISAHEEFIFLKIAGMFRTVASPLIIIPLLYMGFKSIGIVTVTVIISLIVDISYIWFVIFKLECHFSFSNIEKGLFKEIFIFSIFIAVNIIVDQINNNVDKVIIGRYKGTGEVAIYSVGASLNAYFIMFSTSISGVFTPRIHKIVTSFKDNYIELKENLTSLFIKIGRIQFIILSLILSGVIFFGKPFILNIWAGNGYDNSYYVALLLMVPGIVPLMQNAGIEIQRALNIHKYRSIIYGIMALGNLSISIILCKKYGAVGSAIGTMFAVVIANGIIMNIFYHKKCYIDIKMFWKNIFSISKGLIIPIIAGIIIVNYFDLNNIINLIICIFIYTVIFCVSIWFLGFNKFEKDLIRNPINFIFKNKK